jgi:choline kinase
VTNLILLAAGQGTRLAAAVADVPKALVPTPGGGSLLERNLRNARASGAVRRVVVVTGYCAEAIESEIAGLDGIGTVETRHNPDYADHGPVWSIWAARDVLDWGDVMIGNGDTLYGRGAFARVAADGAQGFGLGFSRRPPQPDDVRVSLAVDGSVAAVGKSLDDSATDGISAGLFAVSGAAARKVFSGLLADFMEREATSGRRAIWHDLVNVIAAEGGSLAAREIPEAMWHEIDTPEDYAALAELLGDG